MVALFRVFQTLYKQGDWFSFAKRCAPSSICIDDNRSCMKHWKSGLFLIDRRAIPDSMVWRHLSVTIDDPRPAVGSFIMAGVHRLSVHVITLRDMLEGVLVLSGLSCVWKSRICDLSFPFYYTPPATADVVILDPTSEDLDVGTPSAKIFAKAEASQKQKASTSVATSSHVAKRTRSALAQLSGSTTRRGLFIDVSNNESYDDDDTCVKISLAPEDIMVDDDAAPSIGVSRSRPPSGPAPSFRDVSGDAIHTDFFPFLLVIIMLPTLKVVLLGIASLLTRSRMLATGLLSGC
ncbi:hypothetical protein Tco_1223532 [Tanacetum coccineum]